MRFTTSEAKARVLQQKEKRESGKVAKRCGEKSGVRVKVEIF